MAFAYPQSVIEQTAYWLGWFRDAYIDTIPTQLHSRELDEDGVPQWSPDFARWMNASTPITTPRPEVRTPDTRLRTKKALRRLRKVAVREYEVVYRIMLQSESVEEVTLWLNERAERNAIPLPAGRSVHYSEKDTSCILYSGIDKMRSWW